MVKRGRLENVPAGAKLIYEDFFIGGCDWYAAEYSPADRLFFCYAILHDDFQNAEWGYSSLDEMLQINVHGIEIDRIYIGKSARRQRLSEL